MMNKHEFVQVVNEKEAMDRVYDLMTGRDDLDALREEFTRYTERNTGKCLLPFYLWLLGRLG